jgi:hypothetical protein
MSIITQTKTFSINENLLPLISGDKITFKLSITSTVTQPNFTASLSQGSLNIASLNTLTGYSPATCPYFDSASIVTGSNVNEIIFTAGVSSYYNHNYIFTPNPLSSSLASSSLYETYGDVDYPFISKPYDIMLIFLSDGTYIEGRVLDAYIDNNDLLRVKLSINLSGFAKDDLALGNYKKFLWLTRVEDETNAYLKFQKRPGQTSYGFLIPENLAPDVLANIDTITKEVKQKLISDQSSQIIIGDLTGGSF